MTITQKDNITSYNWLLFFVCFFTTVFAGTVSTLMSVYLPVAVNDLLGKKSIDEINYISAYINSVFIFGAAFGGFLTGAISDKTGRKTALIFSILIYGIYTIATGYMPTWWGVIICRLFSGFGIGGVLVNTTTIMIEEWPLQSRAIFIGILSISMPVGIFSAGAIQYYIADWRHAFLIGFIPILIAFFSIWKLKESEIWKSINNKPIEPYQKSDNLFSKPYRKDLIFGSIIFGTMLIGLWAIFSWVPTWIQSLIPGLDAQKERGLSMMMLGMGGLSGGFLSGWLVNLIGQRKSMILCFAACSFSSFLLFKTNQSFNPIIYGEITILAFFFGASQGVLSIYIPNMFPTSIRGAATGFCFNIGRVFTAAAVLFVGVLVSVLGGYGNSLFIFSLVFIIGLSASYYTKENEPVSSVIGPINIEGLNNEINN